MPRVLRGPAGDEETVETARIADTLGAAGVAASDDNLLAELDLGPMVEAKARLLKHAPSSATEAACLLEIVRQNIADSGRSDSLDARALEAVQIWLADFAVGAPNPRNSGAEPPDPPEPPVALSIAQIQGDGLASPYDGRVVVTEGVVTGTARPIHLGRATQVWEIRIEDAKGRLVCISRMTGAVIGR